MEIIDISKTEGLELEKLSEEEILKILEINPGRISEISPENRTMKMCEIAVVIGGFNTLKYIPKKMWNEHLYFLLSVYNSFYFTNHVPEKYKTKEFFKKVIDFKIENNIFNINENSLTPWHTYISDYALFDGAPKELFNKEMCLKLVQLDGRLLRLVPKRYKTKEICTVALKNIYAVEFLPAKFFTDELIQRILKENCSLIRHIPLEKLTLDICFKAIELDPINQEYLPLELQENKKIINKTIEIKQQVEMSKTASLSSDDDFDFYQKNIAFCSNEIEYTPSKLSENKKPAIIVHKELITRKLNNENSDYYNIYYVTDLHLNHKLLEEFPTAVPKYKIVNYISKLIENMVYINGEKIGSSDDYLLIGGDVSFSFEISQIFYSELIKVWRPKNIIVVLGNHELWDFNRFGNAEQETVDSNFIIKKYRDFFNKLGIIFLHNNLFIKKHSYVEPDTMVSSNYIFKRTDEEIRSLCKKSNFVVLGGLGFSGYNKNVNALNGIYRQTFTSLEEDLLQTQKFENLYNKITQAIPDVPVIVLTHTPKEDWTKSNYNPNWIYVNGHTHHNHYICNEECRVYADNQIGYYSNTISLKYFKLIRYYDAFRYWKDGIYKISLQQYQEFNFGVGIHCTRNRLEEQIILCKKSGLYLFLAQNKNKSKLYILNGGVLNNLKINDIEYYYNNMSKYAETINSGLENFNSSLKSISKQIKRIGGDGYIHGCIVDIDALNHIYLNPLDGKITAYYSPYFGIQQVYKEVSHLLKEQCPEIYRNYIKLISKEYKNEIQKLNDLEIESELLFSTEQYKPSRLIKNLQYITDKNVIRCWNDDFVDGKNIDLSEDIKLIKIK